MECEIGVQKTKIMYLHVLGPNTISAKEKLSKQGNVFFFCFFVVGVYTKTLSFFFSLAITN